MEEILKELLSEIKGIKEGQNVILDRLDRVEQQMATKEESVKISQSVAKMEHDFNNKVPALFDGFTLRGDQIERLQKHLDERLDAIQTDLSYVVSKVAQHERNIVRINKTAK